MDFHTWICVGFGAARCRKKLNKYHLLIPRLMILLCGKCSEKPRRHTRRITLPPEELRQTLDLLLWPCCAFLPLSHPFSKKAAALFLNVIGSDICTALVAWYGTCAHCSPLSLPESSAVLLQPGGRRPWGFGVVAGGCRWLPWCGTRKAGCAAG